MKHLHCRRTAIAMNSTFDIDSTLVVRLVSVFLTVYQLIWPDPAVIHRSHASLITSCCILQVYTPLLLETATRPSR